MLRERRPVPPTNLFTFDENGKKVQLSATDFGARRQERMGSQVRGLAPPPPTQLIQIPQQFLSAEQVLKEALEEKRTLSWRARVAYNAVRTFVARYLRIVERWTRRAQIEAQRLITMYRERMRRMRLKDSWGFDDFTEIAEAPPQFRAPPRRSSVV